MGHVSEISFFFTMAAAVVAHPIAIIDMTRSITTEYTSISKPGRSRDIVDHRGHDWAVHGGREALSQPVLHPSWSIKRAASEPKVATTRGRRGARSTVATPPRGSCTHAAAASCLAIPFFLFTHVVEITCSRGAQSSHQPVQDIGLCFAGRPPRTLLSQFSGPPRRIAATQTAPKNALPLPDDMTCVNLLGADVQAWPTSKLPAPRSTEGEPTTFAALPAARSPFPEVMITFSLSRDAVRPPLLADLGEGSGAMFKIPCRCSCNVHQDVAELVPSLGSVLEHGRRFVKAVRETLGHPVGLVVANPLA